MKVMARTIDNLGLEISNRYAEDREYYDEKIISEARLIPSQTQISSTHPSFASEFDILFELQRSGARWANFFPPPLYYAMRSRIFAEQLIPIMGSPDRQDAQLEKLEALGEEEKKKRNHQPIEAEEVEKERKILLKLLENIHNFDLILIDINSRRSQYQKG